METRLFEEGTIPEFTTPGWYQNRESAPHLEQEGHNDRLLLAADFVRDACNEGALRIVDLGAGDGGLLSILQPPCIGYDLQQSNVDAAKLRGVDVRLQDIVAELPPMRDRDVLICTELLEHLVDPHSFVGRLYDSGASWLVASSPYTETMNSHYEYHCWCWDLAGYQQMIENQGWRMVKQDTAWICQVGLFRRD